MSEKGFVSLGARTLGLFVVAFVLFFSPGSGRSQGTPRDKILEIDSARTAAVEGTRHPLARQQFDAGRLEPERQLSHLSLNFRLSAAGKADLEKLLTEQQDPKSPNFHRWLTPEQYASRFGMSQSDLARVAAWFESQGLTVEGISRNRNAIFFSGSAGQIEYALKAELHKYSVNGEAHFANSTDVSLPEAFASRVLSVRGLDDFFPRPRIRKFSPRFTSHISGSHFLVPGDFATIYDVPSGIDGAGQSIAIVGQTQVSTADIDKFRSAAGLPARTAGNFVERLVPGTGSGATCTDDETEADLDLEWSEGVARNAAIKFVYAGLGSGTTCNNRTKNVFDALEYAVTNDVAPIISISYGNCEANLGNAFVLTLEQWAQQANAQGQTIVGPAGDDGAADCDTTSSATQGLAVDAPASLPEVTGAGGTEFTGDAQATVSSNCAAATTYWKGECNSTDPAGTALGYIPEETWNDTQSGQPFAAGGGGASIVFGKPSWQTGNGVPNDGKRDVPDIALNASDLHDAHLICSQGFYASSSSPAPTTCTNGFRDSTGDLAAVGGTSASAPNFAGILALVSQATSSRGLGNVNPMLYSLAASAPASFHDIQSGNNNVPCTAGTTDCPSGTTAIGFSAGPGYDQVTGLGTLDVSQLITAWKAASPAGDFSIDALTVSSAAGQSTTSGVTVTALRGFTGAVKLTCSAGGSTPVSCSLSPTSVTLTGANPSQSSTLTLTSTADLRLPNRRTRNLLWLQLSGGGVFAAVLLGGLGSRRRWTALVAAALLAMLLTAVGCGGGGSSPTPVSQQSHGPQTFNVTVTGTGTNSSGAALSHSTTLAFTVQ